MEVSLGNNSEAGRPPVYAAVVQKLSQERFALGIGADESADDHRVRATEDETDHGPIVGGPEVATIQVHDEI